MNDAELIWEAYFKRKIYESFSTDYWFHEIDRAVNETEMHLKELNQNRFDVNNVSWEEDQYEDEDGITQTIFNIIFKTPENLYGFDAESQHETIVKDNNQFYLYSEPYHKYSDLNDAKQAAIDNLNRDIINHSTGTFGIATDNSKESYRIFEKFPIRINQIYMPNGWFQTKWGSWYLEARVIIPNTEDDYIDTLKISIRDHDQKSINHQIPDKSFYVSKNWNPEEVGEALKKSISWLSNYSE